MPTTALRTVLVTGANKGIGRAICEKIIAEGPDDVAVLLGSRDLERGKQAAAGMNPDRVTVLELDVKSEESVAAAALAVKGMNCDLIGIVNNAGIGFGNTIAETLDVNFWGTKRVCDHFMPLLSDGGRVCNIASASGPNFVAKLSPADQAFWVGSTTWEQLEARIKVVTPQTDYDNTAYGLSKACVNLYTKQLAAKHSTVVINSCTPGWIATDLTAGMGATNPPEKGALAPMKLLFGDLGAAHGWYFGSDGLRSPLDRYRNPGDPEYTE
ncbi:hypothetical protein TrVE_jg7364 [Triparma verrucosa]|uniref:Uncharacterized protein n=2 Tax=Triparma TaxID=722752 RepID=A0A9W7BI50_9STRA|nr:hypothetical protein TrST_g13907 [Triparma strigata]GMH88360.1 hypothetical protein TrVE_jg7364 [Triparma verrucosa]